MKVSLNTIKQFIDFELPPIDVLVARINAQLGGVEEVIDLNAKYKDAFIVRVVECEKHPNADRLNVCKIDAGGLFQELRSENQELIQVVCGAPNVHAGMWAVWLPPASVVPATFDDKEPFMLGARELRGVMSHGMLAAGDELAIDNDHNGIIEINPDEWRPYQTEIKPGASFATAYGLDDTIIDIENKMFTHRPDLFGQLGVAREIAGILGHQFTSPEWYLADPTFETGEGLELEVFNDTNGKVPRIMFAAMKNVEIKPSPLWLQCALVAMGSKAINNIVDVTNYVMLLTAQPTHAYDYDKLRGHKIGARMAGAGEKLPLLNGKTYELTEDDIVIADGEGAIGLGGIMGGGNSEVSNDTKNIVLEVATFDMYAARKSSMRHGIFTDALTRFNKGQSPLQNDHVMSLLMASVKDVSPAGQASEVYDSKLFSDQNDVVLGERWTPQTIAPSFVNERLGLDFSDDEIAKLLEHVEFDIHKVDTTNLCVTPPFWRTDIELAEDIVEEVGRLYGFDKLPHELPTRSVAVAPVNTLRAAKQQVRESLARAGANEVLTYSFVHEQVIKKAEQDVSQAFRLGNALSPDLQYYRLSVLPSLLDKVHMNIKAGYDEFALFEIGKPHHKQEQDKEQLPREFERTATVYASRNDRPHSAYYQVKLLVHHLLKDLAINGRPVWKKLDTYDFGNHVQTAESAHCFNPSRSSVLEVDDTMVGVVGEFSQSVKRAFKLPNYSAGFELSVTQLSKLSGKTAYYPLSRFPSTAQDISLKTSADVTYAQLYERVMSVLKTSAGDTSYVVEPVSIYAPKANATEKTTTFRITFTNHERTLTDDEIAPIMTKLADTVADNYQ